HRPQVDAASLPTLGRLACCCPQLSRPMSGTVARESVSCDFVASSGSLEEKKCGRHRTSVPQPEEAQPAQIPVPVTSPEPSTRYLTEQLCGRRRSDPAPTRLSNIF